MLTGWGFDRRQASQSQTFTFATDRHEPGPKVLLGVRYDDAGLNEGEAALEALAEHPSTARHLAAKLASHFIADDPPPESVERLARAFTDSGGDLGVVSRALVAEPATWARARCKVRSPAELVVATARATGFHGGEARPLLESLRLLGQLPFFAPSPAGYPDRGAEWIGAQAVVERIEWCASVADRVHTDVSPLALARAVLGPALLDATVEAMAGTPGAAEALALFLASPEFQRR